MVYNGDQNWTAATDISGLTPWVPGLVSDSLPQLKYLMIDENKYTEADLDGLKT